VVELAVGAFGQSPKSENTLLFLSTTLTVRTLGAEWMLLVHAQPCVLGACAEHCMLTGAACLVRPWRRAAAHAPAWPGHLMITDLPHSSTLTLPLPAMHLDPSLHTRLTLGLGVQESAAAAAAEQRAAVAAAAQAQGAGLGPGGGGGGGGGPQGRRPRPRQAPRPRRAPPPSPRAPPNLQSQPPSIHGRSRPSPCLGLSGTRASMDEPGRALAGTPFLYATRCGHGRQAPPARAAPRAAFIS
jgi:hypothetical protein